MIYKCSSCQLEIPEGLPPAPRTPEQCTRCRSTSFVAVHDTLPPPDEATSPGSDMPPPSEEAERAKRGPRPRVLLSTMLYSLAKELGADAATAELYRQLEELAKGDIRAPDDYLPVALTIHRARKLFDVGLLVDAGGTQIGKCRSRQLSEFLRKPDFDTWISIDDDTDCTVAVLAAMQEAVAGGAPAVVIAPTWIRGVPRVSIAFPQVVVERTLVGSGAKLRSAYYGGFGLVAMSREAATRIAWGAEQFDDDDGRLNAAAFAEIIVRHEGRTRWLGEDLSFFARVPPSVRVEALLTGHTRHDGQTLALERVAKGEFPTLEVQAEWLEAKKLHGGQSDAASVRALPEQESVVD
jgi:hypothetical protein